MYLFNSYNKDSSNLKEEHLISTGNFKRENIIFLHDINNFMNELDW